MSTTIQTQRPGLRVAAAQQAHYIPMVHDHVPPDVAAEHPDAAAVVAATSARPTPRGGVRVVGRGEERPVWVLRILGLAACAVLATLTADSERSGAGASSVTEATATAPPVATTDAVEPNGCAPGTSVIVRCAPPCDAPTLLNVAWTPCALRETTT